MHTAQKKETTKNKDPAEAIRVSQQHEQHQW
jgi:hypothetical protein